MVYHRKEEAAWKMLEKEMENIVEYSQHGFVTKFFWKNWSGRQHNYSHISTILGIKLHFTETIIGVYWYCCWRPWTQCPAISAKQMRFWEWKRYTRSNHPTTKTRRTPNTIPSNNRVIVRKNLWHRDSNAAEENQQREMKKIEKVEGAQGVLT